MSEESSGKSYAWLLDRIEQVASLVFIGWLAFRLWPGDFTIKELVPLLILAGEGLVVFFLLIRKPSEDISRRGIDWVVAYAGSLLPLMVSKADSEPIHVGLGAGLLLVGIAIQVSAKVSLNRSFGLVAANRGVKTSGAYRFVRHPMYLGYMTMHVGFLLVAPILWNLCIYLCVWGLLVWRISMEERVLSESETYRAFKEETPWRLLPYVF